MSQEKLTFHKLHYTLEHYNLGHGHGFHWFKVAVCIVPANIFKTLFTFLNDVRPDVLSNGGNRWKLTYNATHLCS